MLSVNTAHHELLKIAEEPLGEGGEGKVYPILSPDKYQDYVVKIYHPRERTPEREAKLQYMLANRPPILNDFSVVWVADLVYQNGEFVGFLMLQAVSSVDLTYLTGLQISNKLSRDWADKYSRETVQGFRNRAKLCYNIASAVWQIHQSGKYVLVDLKPENLKIQLNGQVSLIDTDSIQIIENEQVIFPARKLSPEYSPAEIKQLSIGKDYIPETWDRFSLAVVFYKVLFGLHPFAVTGKAEYQQLNSHEQKIQAGLFPFGDKSADIQVVPPPHANFEALPFAVRMLFVRAFAQGYQLPTARPSAQDWCEQLLDFEPISQNYQSPIRQTGVPNPSADNQPAKLGRKFDEHSSIIARTVVVFFLLASLVSFCNRMDWLDFSYQAPETIDYQKALAIVEAYRANPNNQNKVETLELGLGYKAIRVKGHGYWGIMRGASLIKDLVFESIEPFVDSLAIFKQNRRFGMLDQNLKIVIRNEYEYLDNLSEGLILAQKDRRYGYLNERGDVILRFQFDGAESFEGGKARVSIGKDEFYINLGGICLENCPDNYPMQKLSF
ncbi:MAG: WG repeat-containing protein [Microscillaceae bacterium]|jgi:serine/threonine protein kinase|nr:WG repeat-containing protein [Microscillaceae bacterium]